MTTDIIEFLVQGSTKDPYKVSFAESKSHGEKIYLAFCTCKAGQIGSLCKHRMNIFEGSKKNIVSGDLEKAELLANWYKGSIYKQIMIKIDKYEKEYKEIQSKLRSEKRFLAKMMNNEYPDE